MLGRPTSGAYDIIPYAITSDGYDTIEDVDIDEDEQDDSIAKQFAPRTGPLPTPGYAGLLPEEPKGPGVYSRMDHYDQPVENAYEKGNPTTSGPAPYLQLFNEDDAKEPLVSKESSTADPAPYLHLLNNDVRKLDKQTSQETTNVQSKTDDDVIKPPTSLGNDISSSYLNFTDDAIKPFGEIKSSYISFTDDVIESKSPEISSSYLRFSDDVTKVIKPKVPANEIKSSYLTFQNAASAEPTSSEDDIPSSYLKMNDDVIRDLNENKSAYLMTNDQKKRDQL